MQINSSTIYGALAGAITLILAWAAKQFGHVDIPADVQGAVTIIVQTGVTHFVPDGPKT